MVQSAYSTVVQYLLQLGIYIDPFGATLLHGEVDRRLGQVHHARRAYLVDGSDHTCHSFSAASDGDQRVDT